MYLWQLSSTNNISSVWFGTRRQFVLDVKNNKKKQKKPNFTKLF